MNIQTLTSAPLEPWGPLGPGGPGGPCQRKQSTITPCQPKQSTITPGQRKQSTITPCQHKQQTINIKTVTSQQAGSNQVAWSLLGHLYSGVIHKNGRLTIGPTSPFSPFSPDVPGSPWGGKKRRGPLY